MPVEIDQCQPDGLTVKFAPFIFDTYQEAFDFILEVDELNRKSMMESREKTKKLIAGFKFNRPLDGFDVKCGDKAAALAARRKHK